MPNRGSDFMQDKPPTSLPEVRESVHRMGRELSTINTTMDTISGDVHDIKKSLGDLLKAFPAGDLDGHRRYHDAIIERNHEIRKLRYAIQEKTIFGLLWLALGLIGASVWFYVSAKLTSHGSAPQ